MCGVFGVAAARGRALSVGGDEAQRLCDLLAHRGPDGSGLWEGQGALLAHRRLAVLDPTDAGAQPMRTGDGRFVLVYNGELYNDLELRAALEAKGAAPEGGWRSRCDAETALQALAVWGPAALDHFRGMYALALWDDQRRTLLLARDLFGIKPLCFWTDGSEVVFASEPAPILGHPRVPVEPSLAMVGAYLTTIRTVLGNNTLFEGVYALAPGERALFDCAAKTIRLTVEQAPPPAPLELDEADAAGVLFETLCASTRAHLRSDVPTCALLSGGLDSTALVSEAVRAHPNLRTFAAGAVEDVDDEAASDLTFARRAAEALGAAHDQAPITRELFRQRWPWLVEQQGLPLSTPNEVAIYTVARRLRDEGCVVTLSGEGADELLAGYEGPLDSAWRFEQALAEQNASGDDALRARALFQLESNAWAPSRLKPILLREPVLRACEGDGPLAALYEQLFRQAAKETPSPEPLALHLRFQQQVNLTGLLQRLDSATMQASVEGRTPYADVCVAQLARSLPLRLLYEPPPAEPDIPGAVAVAAAPRTKLLLRQAFAHRVPREVLERPKASFPLPFQRWIADHAQTLRHSAFAREVFTPDAIAMVARDPTSQWRLAWPMINLAMWGDRWWS